MSADIIVSVTFQGHLEVYTIAKYHWNSYSELEKYSNKCEFQSSFFFRNKLYLSFGDIVDFIVFLLLPSTWTNSLNENSLPSYQLSSQTKSFIFMFSVVFFISSCLLLHLFVMWRSKLHWLLQIICVLDTIVLFFILGARRKRSERLLNNGCLAHLTAMAITCLSQYVRYLLEAMSL